ncbi:hypothetical protein [Limnobacter sp.]
MARLKENAREQVMECIITRKRATVQKNLFRDNHAGVTGQPGATAPHTL